LLQTDIGISTPDGCSYAISPTNHFKKRQGSRERGSRGIFFLGLNPT